MPSAVKLSDDLVEAARHESRVWSRSMTQQIEHWARIGRALERGGDVSMGRVRRALTADLHFDELTDDERAVVSGSLDRSVSRLHGDSGLAAELLASGRPLSTVDQHGVVVMVDGAEDAPST